MGNNNYGRLNQPVRQQPSPYFRFRIIDCVFMYGD